MPYQPGDDPPPPRTPTFGPEDLRNHFVRLAGEQAGDKYRYGAEARDGDADPTAFDSSELVEWAAHRSGVRDMPDGSWNQYRFLHERGGATSLEEALHTKGALVFGFSSDPLGSPDRPARAYVAISMGDGKNVIDVSERGGEVRVMPHGGFYGYGAKIPEFHTPDELLPPPGIGIDTDGDGVLDSTAAPGAPSRGVVDDPAFPRQPVPEDDFIEMDRRTTEPGPAGRWHYPDPVSPGRSTGPGERPGLVSEPDDDPVVPGPSYGPGGRILHEPLPARPGEQPGLVSEPDPDPDMTYRATPSLDGPAGYPHDGDPTSPAEPVLPPDPDVPAYADANPDPDPFADAYTDLSADV
jgi:hypothetical protein